MEYNKISVLLEAAVLEILDHLDYTKNLRNLKAVGVYLEQEPFTITPLDQGIANKAWGEV